jgi:hypothetical protein
VSLGLSDAGGAMMTEAIEWLVLRRVHEGSVTKLDGHYFRRGQLVDYLADTLDELVGRGLLALGQPDPIGQQQVCVTHAGQHRYAELCPSRGDGRIGESGR